MTALQIDDGGPAFPGALTVGPNGDIIRPADLGCEGMSLRDHFAGQAMQALIAAGPDALNSVTPNGEPLIASLSFALADTMIAARKVQS